MDNGMSLADVAALNGNGIGGNGNWWLVILFLFAFGGNGFGFGNWNNNALTQQDALINSNFDNLARNVQSISDRQYEQANGLTKGICELGYTIAQQTNGLQTNLGGAIVAEGRNMQQSICEVKEAVHAEGEATRAMIQQNKIDAMQAEIAELKTAQMLCGIPKTNPYGYGIYPYNAAGNGCGCRNL